MNLPFAMCFLTLVSTLPFNPPPATTDRGRDQSQEEQKQETTSEKKPEPEDKNQKADKRPGLVFLSVKVADADTSAPIVGASVYVRAEREGKVVFDREPRTDKNGEVRIPDVPVGWVLIQVTKDGWSTDGKNQELSKKKESVIVQLKKLP